MEKILVFIENLPHTESLQKEIIKKFNNEFAGFAYTRDELINSLRKKRVSLIIYFSGKIENTLADITLLRTKYSNLLIVLIKSPLENLHLLISAGADSIITKYNIDTIERTIKNLRQGKNLLDAEAGAVLIMKIRNSKKLK